MYHTLMDLYANAQFYDIAMMYHELWDREKFVQLLYQLGWRYAPGQLVILSERLWLVADYEDI
jgi:hypothetical protein